MLILHTLMNNVRGKIISIFIFLIFFFASGAGQLIHVAFHDHGYTQKSYTNSSTINSYHYYCTALQLMLPEFSNTGIPAITSVIPTSKNIFVQLTISVPQLYSFKASGRAPPVLA